MKFFCMLLAWLVVMCPNSYCGGGQPTTELQQHGNHHPSQQSGQQPVPNIGVVKTMSIPNNYKDLQETLNLFSSEEKAAMFESLTLVYPYTDEVLAKLDGHVLLSADNSFVSMHFQNINDLRAFFTDGTLIKHVEKIEIYYSPIGNSKDIETLNKEFIPKLSKLESALLECDEKTHNYIKSFPTLSNISRVVLEGYINFLGDDLRRTFPVANDITFDAYYINPNVLRAVKNVKKVAFINAIMNRVNLEAFLKDNEGLQYLEVPKTGRWFEALATKGILKEVTHASLGDQEYFHNENWKIELAIIETLEIKEFNMVETSTTKSYPFIFTGLKTLKVFGPGVYTDSMCTYLDNMTPRILDELHMIGVSSKNGLNVISKLKGVYKIEYHSLLLNRREIALERLLECHLRKIPKDSKLREIGFFDIPIGELKRFKHNGKLEGVPDWTIEKDQLKVANIPSCDNPSEVLSSGTLKLIKQVGPIH